MRSLEYLAPLDNNGMRIKIYSSKPGYNYTLFKVKALGNQPDLFISDPCCYSHPRFHETAKSVHKLGGGDETVAAVIVYCMFKTRFRH